MSAIQIVQIEDEKANTFSLNISDFERVLYTNDVKDRSLVIISIAGPTRKGKSFMLNFFLRYLKAKYVNKTSSDNWMGAKNDQLTGFDWRGGFERMTTGILVWPELFLHDYANGDKVAIMLMDTQGTFDNKSTFRSCVTIFALSTLLSSVQIYNLSREVEETNLQYLTFFAEYGKMVKGESLGKPFQKLQFLIRDWPYPYEAPYGAKGGFEVIKNLMKKDFTQSNEIQQVRKNIDDSFDVIDGFLMPHPGKAVTNSVKYKGELKDIDADFIKELKNFVPKMLAPENLIIKKINGNDLKVKDFIHFLISYKKSLSGSALPSPKTIFEATSEAQNISAVSNAKEKFNELMDNNFNPDVYTKTEDLQKMHDRNNEIAVKNYRETKKVESSDNSKYVAELEESNKKKFYHCLVRNERNKPEFGAEIKELIDIITNQQNVIDVLTEENTKTLLETMNVLNENREKYQKEIADFKKALEAAEKQPKGFLKVIKTICDTVAMIVPVVAQLFKLKSK